MAKPFKCFDEREVDNVAAITGLKLFEDVKKVLQLIIFAPDLFDEKCKVRPFNTFMKKRLHRFPEGLVGARCLVAHHVLP